MDRTPDDHRVVTLPPTDAPAVVDVFCDAFRDYPVMRFVLGDDQGDYASRLRTLITLFVMARAFRDEPLLGIVGAEGLRAAATMSFPGTGGNSTDFEALRERVWAELGAGARARYEACGETWGRLDAGVPHVHLNMIGVRKAFQGTGLARRLLDQAHSISRETPGSQGVTLTTEVAGNVDVYRHFGYEVVGSAHIAPAVETWSMFRRD